MTIWFMPDHIMCETRGVVKSMAIGMNHHKNYHWDIWWASHTTESSCMSRQIAEGVVGSVLPTTLSCTHQPAPLFESSAWLPRRLLHHPTRSTNICVQLPLQWTRLPLRLVTQSRNDSISAAPTPESDVRKATTQTYHAGLPHSPLRHRSA